MTNKIYATRHVPDRKEEDMATENELPKQASNEQLWTDIANTQSEKEAYEKLADGYEKLARLPENQTNGMSNLHSCKSQQFLHLAEQCGTLLETLLALKTLQRLDP